MDQVRLFIIHLEGDYMTVEFWFLIGAALVFWMQAGFAMVEAGFTRAKNAGNIIMKNLMDFCIGTVVFALLGYTIMMGEDTLFGLIGIPNMDLFAHFKEFIASPANGDFTAASTFVFNLVFCATTATIVSGAMAERTKFSAYCIYSGVISLFVYPIEAHWIWGGGWLSQLGFHDYAGSCAIHMVGGIAALVGAVILGPRLGKYERDENGKVVKVNAFPGHNIVIGALGVFILWLGWYGFNGAAATTPSELASIFLTTTIAPAVATCVTMAFTWIKNGKPDVSMPVGAVGVHMANGIWGTIAVGLLANPDAPAGLSGLFYTGDFTQLGIQLLGFVSVAAYAAVMMIITFKIIKKTVGLRASAEEEIVGLDITEHGLPSAYAGFAATAEDYSVYGEDVTVVLGDTPVAEAVEVKTVPTFEKGDSKFTKIEIICKEARFEKLKRAMAKLGITGMTVTHVMGYGAQKGKPEYYRGVPVETNLLPKMQVEMVVSAIPVRDVIETAKKALYTGHIGDGKIFVYDVENVVKIRTGEEGYDALQGDD